MMSRKTILFSGVAAVVVVAIIGAVLLVGGRGGGSDEAEGDLSPIGGLFDRMHRVARLKERMGELRGVWPAMDQFARSHQGMLPTNLVELRPYLPANLTSLSDERWEMPSAGMEAKPVMARNDAILLEQKAVRSGSARILVYGDGHIEYRK